MAIQSIPRFLLARPLPLVKPSTLRFASSLPKGLSDEFRRRAAATKPKAPPVIPQPDKFRPPSHSNRSRNRDLENRVYGPPITAEEKQRMAAKKYPNMMSPQGSFSHWFLNTRSIHLWITLGILFSLGAWAAWIDFLNKTIYADFLPSRKDFWWHPVVSTRRFIEVYLMHSEQQSALITEQRLKKAEDVEKRKLFRQQMQREAEERGEEYVVDPRYYVGEDGVRRRRVKRWFGIWE